MLGQLAQFGPTLCISRPTSLQSSAACWQIPFGSKPKRTSCGRRRRRRPCGEGGDHGCLSGPRCRSLRLRSDHGDRGDHAERTQGRDHASPLAGAGDAVSRGPPTRREHPCCFGPARSTTRSSTTTPMRRQGRARARASGDDGCCDNDCDPYDHQSGHGATARRPHRRCPLRRFRHAKAAAQPRRRRLPRETRQSGAGRGPPRQPSELQSAAGHARTHRCVASPPLATARLLVAPRPLPRPRRCAMDALARGGWPNETAPPRACESHRHRHRHRRLRCLRRLRHLLRHLLGLAIVH